jgi:hypothetical protein
MARRHTRHDRAAGDVLANVARGDPRSQTIPVVGAERQEAFLKQLPKDFEALVVGEMEEPPGLRDGWREASHVAELAAHPFNQLLIRVPAAPCGADDRRHLHRPDWNVLERALGEGEWFARSGTHTLYPTTGTRYAGPSRGAIR